MSDYSFMKSGVTSASSVGTIDVDMMHKLVAVVKTLMQDAVNSAEQFVKACGRSMIQDKDISMALKYETHHFLLQGDSLDKKFQTNLEVTVDGSEFAALAHHDALMIPHRE